MTFTYGYYVDEKAVPPPASWKSLMKRLERQGIHLCRRLVVLNPYFCLYTSFLIESRRSISSWSILSALHILCSFARYSHQVLGKACRVYGHTRVQLWIWHDCNVLRKGPKSRSIMDRCGFWRKQWSKCCPIFIPSGAPGGWTSSKCRRYMKRRLGSIQNCQHFLPALYHA